MRRKKAASATSANDKFGRSRTTATPSSLQQQQQQQTASSNVIYSFHDDADDNANDDNANDDGRNESRRSSVGLSSFIGSQFFSFLADTTTNVAVFCSKNNNKSSCSRKNQHETKYDRKLSRTISGLLVVFLYSIVQCIITTLAASHFLFVSSTQAVSTASVQHKLSNFSMLSMNLSSNFMHDNFTINSRISEPVIPSVLAVGGSTALTKKTPNFFDSLSSRSKRFAPPNMRGFTETQILDELFKNYDNRTRPFGVYPNGTFGNGGGPKLKASLREAKSYVSMQKWNLKNTFIKKEYTSTITFREEWVDQRLAYDDGGEHEFLVLSDPNKVWKPDLFFYPEKEGWFHAITTPNVLFRIYGTGRVLYSVRLSMVLSCFMQLHLFPLDYQNCTLDMASYAYTTDDIIFYWKEDNPVQLRENILNLPRFQLENVLTGDCSVKTNTGAYSCLKVELHFLRQLNYFIFQTYVPSIMLVIASWVSFWLDQDAIPARITLGVTTLLTVITSTHSINAKLPPVSYTKAIDVWTGACTFFVFAALIEFALVNYASRRERPPAPPGGKRALRKRGATSMRHRGAVIPQQQQQQLHPPPSAGFMPLSRQPSPSHYGAQHQQHQPLHNVYSDMDSETALFLANNTNNMNDVSNQFVDTMLRPQDPAGGGGGTPRETSFHRFPAPGEEDLFDFTGGPHLRVTSPSNGQRLNNVGYNHQRSSGRNSTNRMNNTSNEAAANFLCDRILSGGGRQSLLASAADCGGMFPPPPPPTSSLSPPYTMQPPSSSAGGNAFRRGTTQGGDVPSAAAATVRQRGLIGKYFRWPASKAKKIDFVSRVLFPALFSVFNCIYWSVYVTARDRFRHQNS